MPTYLDLGVIAVVLISAFLAMLRGFTREVLAIAAWGAAAVAAIYLYPFALPYVTPHIANKNIALGVSAAAVFFVTLIAVSVITIKFSDAILNSKIGALDRSLGFLFGAVRGLLLCVIAFVFFNWLVPAQTQPGWVKTARMRPLLQVTGDRLMAISAGRSGRAFEQTQEAEIRRRQRGDGARHGSGTKKRRDRQRDVSAGTGAFWGGEGIMSGRQAARALAATNSWGKLPRFDDVPERGLA